MEFRGGLFYVTYCAGEECTTYAMRPSTFFAAIADAVEKSRDYAGKGAKILPIRA